MTAILNITDAQLPASRELAIAAGANPDDCLTSNGVMTLPGITQAAADAAFAAFDFTGAANKALIAAIEAKAEEILQAAARRRMWANLDRCLTYSGSNAAWQADKMAMVAWYDAMWAYVFAQEKVTPLPSVATIEAGINALPSNPGW